MSEQINSTLISYSCHLHMWKDEKERDRERERQQVSQWSHRWLSLVLAPVLVVATCQKLLVLVKGKWRTLEAVWWWDTLDSQISH